MSSFALSERWNGWSRLYTMMVVAERATIAAGPLDPVVCDVTIEADEDTVTPHDLDALLAAGEEPPSLDIYIAHVVEAQAPPDARLQRG